MLKNGLNRRLVHTCCVLALLYLSGNVRSEEGLEAAADAPKGNGGGKKECREAAKKLCGNVERGEGRKIECMEKSISQLPEQCREGAQKRLAEAKEIYAKREKCRTEAEAICPKGKEDSKDDKKAFRQCLKENQDKISQECKDLRGKRKQQKK